MHRQYNSENGGGLKASRAIDPRASLVFALVSVGSVLLGACSGGGGGSGTGGAGGTAGKGGSSGVDAGVDVPKAAGGSTGAGGSTETGGSTGAGGSDNGAGGAVDVDAGFGDAALPPDAGTVSCPTTIVGSLDTTDSTQTGRHARNTAPSVCGTTKGFPSLGPDSTNPHLYDVYRFVNPTAAAVCFSFNLTWGVVAVVDGGSDAMSVADGGGDVPVGQDSGGAVDGAADGANGDATTGADAAGGAGGSDAAGTDAATDTGVPVGPQRYLTAYSTFYPQSLAIGYLGDVGSALPPQTMGITVPPGGTIDVVVYAVAVAPDGVGSYTLTCSTQ